MKMKLQDDDTSKSFPALVEDFHIQLCAVIGLTWANWMDLGIERRKIEETLARITLKKMIGAIVKSFGPEEAANFIFAILTERLEAYRAGKDDLDQP
jgi:hypothetical protein